MITCTADGKMAKTSFDNELTNINKLFDLNSS